MRARRVTTFLFTCSINHLYHPSKIRNKCLKIRCHNLIIETEKTIVTPTRILQYNGNESEKRISS